MREGIIKLMKGTEQGEWVKVIEGRNEQGDEKQLKMFGFVNGEVIVPKTSPEQLTILGAAMG